MRQLDIKVVRHFVVAEFRGISMFKNVLAEPFGPWCVTDSTACSFFDTVQQVKGVLSTARTDSLLISPS